MTAFRIALVLFGITAMVTVAQAGEPIVIKFSHVAAVDTPKGKGALKFKQLAEARTGGRVKIEVYPNSQLFKDKEELESLQLGAVQMLAPSVSKFGPLGLKEFDAFELPYLFDSYAQLHKVTQGRVGKQMLERLEAKGIIGLAYWDNGFREMSANKELKTPDDCKGLKFRIASSKVLEANVRSLGGIPQVMAFSEVYQGLQTGVVDGTENSSSSNFYTQKLHEVQKFLTLTDHSVSVYAVVVNKRFWNDLPRDIRVQLESAMTDASRYVNDIAKGENDRAVELVRASGKTVVRTLTEDEKRAWKKAMVVVHEQHADKIGKELVEALYKETGFDPGKL